MYHQIDSEPLILHSILNKITIHCSKSRPD